MEDITMTQVNIHMAKAHLSELIQKVLLGEEVIIARDNKPLVKLVALHPTKQPLEKFILNQLQENSIQQLHISFRHIMQIKTLDFHHRDPFDRLLIAQAITEDLTILSNDHAFDHYGVKRLW